MYSFIRPILFKLNPETAHAVALASLQYLPKPAFSSIPAKMVHALGMEFSHPIGLAAGFDKNGDYLDALAKLGFSFIELGTVTPRPQSGNPKPRIFRLPQAHAIINRLGFNNKGVDALIANIKKANYNGILGINIGKNKDTPLDKAADDYLHCFRKVHPFASYVTLNISSPNTQDLRQLQKGEYFNNLINQLREEQLHLADTQQRYVPLVVKISPDEDDETLKNMACIIVSCGIDGIIATNTTSGRDGVKGLMHATEIGGLSGRPLAARSTHSLRILKEIVGNQVTLIGVGGIDQLAIAREKLLAGASLLQLYTGLIYEGPGLIKTLVTGL